MLLAQNILVSMISNAALLLVLSVIYEVSYMLPPGFDRLRPVIRGAMIAAVCVAVMSMPFTMAPGLIFDTRTIIISVTALVYGVVPAAITAAAAMVFRIFIGGYGLLPGLATIVSSALIGLAWRKWARFKGGRRPWLNALLMGITVHIAMLACMLLLPGPDSVTVLRTIALPVMLVYPAASVLLSLLLLHQQRYRHMQQQMAESEERFSALFDKAPLGYQSLDIDGRFLDVNRQWLDMLGYSRPEVLGRRFLDFLMPDEVEKFRGEFERFKKTGSAQIEFEMRHRSGRPVSVQFEGKVGTGKDGSFQQTYCILKDISLQKAAEEQLRVSEEKYRRLFETMAQGVVYQAADGVILSANPAAERILGMSLSQMQGRTSQDPSWRAIREDGAPLEGAEHPAMVSLRTGKPFGPFTMGVIHAGTDDYVWISVIAIPLFHEGEEKPYQVYATFQDITAERSASRNYRQLFNEMVDAFALHEIILDDRGVPADYRFLAVNPAFEQVTGLKASDILGRTVKEVLPDVEPWWIERYGAVALSGEPVRFSNYNVSSGRYFEVSAYQPAPMQFACTFSDVTQRIQAEQALKESREQYFSYIENAPFGVFVVNAKGQYREVNRYATLMTGYSRPQLLSMSIGDITAEKSREAAMRGFELLKQGGNQERELQYIHQDGSLRWLTVHAVKLSEDRFLSYQIDITEKKDAEAQLHYLASHDYLTGLFNRGYFEEELKRLDQANHLPLTIMIGDINGVKLINDTFGHAEGDRLIVDCARIVEKCLRAGDIFARTGGDEFGVIMPGTDNEAAAGVVEKIQESLSAFDHNAGADSFHHSISLGFATKTSADEDISQVIRTADKQMYQRKLLEHSSSHSTIISSIKATINEKSHETAEHAERLVALSKRIAATLNLQQIERDKLELLVTLHDIGKIGISERILMKRGELDEHEWTEMKRHPEIGYRIANSTPDLIPIAESILCHHERWDGCGYPQGLKGDSIPLLSRVLSIVDAYDAMTQDRPYRSAMSHEEAVAEIVRCSGTQFDPEIARILIDQFK